MQGNRGNIPHVPWSRHMVVSPKATFIKNHSEDNEEDEGASKKKQGSSREMSGKRVSSDRRRVESESSLLNWGRATVDEDSWDSQSDPGSTSLRKLKGYGYSSKLSASEKAESDSSCSQITKPEENNLQPSPQRNIIRKRKRAKVERVEGVAENGDSVVEILDEGAVQNNPSPRYVHTYNNFMYYACLNLHKWTTKEEDDKTKTRYFLGIIQKVRSWLPEPLI